MDDGTELLKVTAEDRKADEPQAWATQVWEACGGVCSNCGSDDRVKARMIVPEESGGKKVVGNGTLLCRTCELATTISTKHPEPASGEHTRPINFFVSTELHSKLKNGLAADYGFRSVSALVRFLMGQFVQDSERFDDVGFYQEEGSDVKVNVWVARDVYANFKAITDRDGTTVTGTLRGLLRMYEAEAERIVGRTRT